MKIKVWLLPCMDTSLHHKKKIRMVANLEGNLEEIEGNLEEIEGNLEEIEGNLEGNLKFF